MQKEEEVVKYRTRGNKVHTELSWSDMMQASRRKHTMTVLWEIKGR